MLCTPVLILDISADSSKTESLWTTEVTSRTANSIREESAVRDEDVDCELMETEEKMDGGTPLHSGNNSELSLSISKSPLHFTSTIDFAHTIICF